MARRDRDEETSTRSKKRGGGEDMNFTPVDYDVSEMPVDAPEGAYDAKIKSVKVRGTKEDNYPMLELEFRLVNAHNEDGDDAVKAGASLTSFLAFFPASEGRRGAPSKIAMRALIDSLHLDEDLIPTRIESKRDLNDLIDALKGQELTIYVVHREDKQSGEVRCDVRFKAPKNLSTKDRGDEEDDDRASRKGKNGKSNGNGARARDRDEDEEDEPRINARGGSDRRAKDDDEDEDEPRSAKTKGKGSRDRDEDEDEPPARSRSRRDDDEDERPRRSARN